MRKLLSILVALSLCASFASLSLAEEETREVIFWHAMGGVNGEMITQLTDEYNETLGKEQGIHVTAIFQGLYADMRTKFMGAIQAQDMANLPDIVQMGASALGMMQEVQEVVWFEDILAMDTTMKLEDFEPKFVRSFSAEGRALGVPFASSTVILYYNEDMLREAGIEAPPATLAEMGEAAAKLYKEENGEPVQWGFVCQPGSWFMSSWIGMQASSEGNYSYIGNNADGREGVMTQVVFDEEGTMKRFLENYKAACEAGHFKVTSTNDLEEFAAGKVAMYIGSTSAFASVLQTVGDKFSFGCAFMPTVTAEDVGGVAAGGSSLYLLNRGDEQKMTDALRFLEYMTSAETQFKWHEGTGYFPVNVNAYDLPQMAERLEQYPQVQVMIDQLQASDPHVQEPLTGVSGTIDSSFMENILGVVTDELTIDEAVENMADEINEALEAYLQTLG
ncbi:MAG: ABC transporter substrate-binding protein [Christensenellales bacterium]|nr:ABC transporter substrate-binding protein [Christensenellales bacterium]